MHPELAVLEELVDIVPGSHLRRTDRQRFLRSLGIATCPGGSDNEAASPGKLISTAWVLRVLGNAAFEMPLPPKWTEQVDTRGYVYFAHALRAEATWEHPLLQAFQETLDFASAISSASESVDEAAGAVKAHLRQIQDRAARELQHWTGPHRETGSTDEYFFNEKIGESTWESPLEGWQYELHARYWLLVQLLQNMHVQAFGSQRLDDTAQSESAADETMGDTRSSHTGTHVRDSNHSRSGAFSFIESTLSTSGLSNAVRSHASSIASSLASSAPTFGDNSICPPPYSGTEELCIPVAPPSQPRPPKKPPPPLRHLAAPPRATEIPPEHALRIASPTLLVHKSNVVAVDVPPPPPSSSLGSTAKVKTPPPPPKKLELSYDRDEENLEASPDSPKTPASKESPESPQSIAQKERKGKHDLEGIAEKAPSSMAGQLTADSAATHQIARTSLVKIRSMPAECRSEVAELAKPLHPPDDSSDRLNISSSHSDSEFAGRTVKKRGTLASMVCVVM